MTLAYLMNTYPITSTTFVRREIEAHEAAGTSVRRYALRPWADRLVDPRDEAEKARTTYILAGNAAGLLAAATQTFFAGPMRFFAAFGAAFSLLRAARGGLVPHVAYFLEACWFARDARKAGVVHVHAHFSTNAAAVVMLARRLGGPSYSFTVHGPDELDDAKLLSLQAKISGAKFVAAITHFTRAQLIRFSSSGLAPKIHVVRCGVFVDEFEPQPPAPASRTIVCVGRLSAQKSQALLPRVMRRVGAVVPDARLLLVGDGPDRAIIEQEIAAHDVAGSMTLLGWRDNRDVARLMAEARAVLLPSAAEGLPIVLMEALALARPVIATYIAGIPELVDAGCGWITPAGDEDLLVAALVEAFQADNATLARLGSEGRRRVEARHDQRRNAAALRALFDGPAH